ncbi:LOG family protein [Sandaracinus amylolyticus]|uniref:LOG family protein n=1 Tax=Sandaracinus amylolyticus TaxID=927083 RepID=UPI001F2A785E|nr:LOG family protein [Sandaracinus amylolyticus]
MLKLWEVVNGLTRLRPSKQERYRVTIFGSARAEPGTFVYDETRRVARALTELGCDIVTGGGPGLMSAANAGASDAASGAGARSMGIRISLPFEQTPNAFVTQMYEHRTFFTRLHHFVLASDAYIVAPGGIGTVLEAMMIWQLLQVGHLSDKPLVFVGPMWSDLVRWARTHMLGADLAFASEQELSIPRCAVSSAEAIEVVRADHERWMRARKHED